jgi:hypothetical protein
MYTLLQVKHAQRTLFCSMAQKRLTFDPPQESSAAKAPRLEGTRVVRLRRKGGVVVQDCDVYIGRECKTGGWNLPRSKWANPFTIRSEGSSEAAVARYRAYVLASPTLMASLDELRGKTLGCWCKPKPCHGDVLVHLLSRAGPGSANSGAGPHTTPTPA